MSFLKAQQVRVPNLSGSYLPQSYPLFNPASIKAATNKANILLSHKQGTGVFSVFNQNYFNANLRFGSDSVRKHAIGLRVLNDQAGKYIGVNRVSLLYSYSLVLSERYNLNLGVAPTIIYYRKKAQNFGDDATAYNLDLGLWFSTKKLMLGASINQIIQNELIVIEEVTLIQSQYVLNAKYNHKIHPLVSLDYQILYKINTGLPNEEMIGFAINYHKSYRASINYEHIGTVYFLLGLKEFSVPKLLGKVSVDFIYGLPTMKSTYKPRNVVELMMNYEF
jgi:type IX secretion system PorP/SprF family membrane protein